LSGPGLTADHELVTGERIDPGEIARSASAGAGAALATLDRYTERLAASLALVINILDPEVIVLGGGLSNVDFLYEAVPLRWGEYVFSDRVDTRLEKNLHGDSSGVRGAAWLWEAAE
jgi:fructokinase